MYKRGTIHIIKLNFNENEFGISFSFESEEEPNLKTKAFRTFKNQYVGHPNMTIFKDIDSRNQRYEEGKQFLINAGYTIVEKEITG